MILRDELKQIEIRLHSIRLQIAQAQVHLDGQDPELQRQTLSELHTECQNLEVRKKALHKELHDSEYRNLHEKLLACQKEADILKYRSIPEQKAKLLGLQEELKRLEIEVLTLSSRMAKLSYS